MERLRRIKGVALVVCSLFFPSAAFAAGGGCSIDWAHGFQGVVNYVICEIMANPGLDIPIL